MATQAQPFLAAAPATRIARVSNTTLFQLAARFYGDALYWVVIARANGMIDPWITGQANILIPDFTAPSVEPSGIGSPVSGAIQSAPAVAPPSVSTEIVSQGEDTLTTQSDMEIVI